MSNALAIAGVSAVVRDLLNNGFIDHRVTDAMGQGVTVTAVAPDLVQTTGADARPRLNIFLYQVTFNAALRNNDLPSRNDRGERISNPSLALDLHYLITAYGVQDLQAEVLLSYAMQLLHETPILTREAIRIALAPPGVDAALLPTIYQALRASALADQIETLKITPATVNSDELSRLWTAVQTHYRPSMPYVVTVVLIDNERPARSPLPVLTRGPRDPLTGIERGIVTQSELDSPFPDIVRVVPPNQQIAVRLGETVEVIGSRLDGVTRSVSLTHPRFGFTRVIPAVAGDTSERIRFVVPNDPVNLPAGTYLLTVSVLRTGEAEPREAGPLLLALAPRITTALPITAVRDAQQTASVTLSLEPNVRPEQQVSLLLGTRDVPTRIAASTNTATFEVLNATAGSFYARLRVDGVESILVDRTVTPPQFRNDKITVV